MWLFQTLSVRTLHKQLVRLLTPQEQDELKTKDMFKPFIGKFWKLYQCNTTQPQSPIPTHFSFNEHSTKYLK